MRLVQQTITFSRKIVRQACVLFAGLLVLLPLALGPALGPMLQALGAQVEHHCACGMIQGQCGCPECEAVDREKKESRKPSEHPVAKTSCDDDESLPPPVALPPVILVRDEVEIVQLAVTLPLGSSDVRALLSAEPRAPQSPPPRLSLV